jgi:hypothetical protein
MTLDLDNVYPIYFCSQNFAHFKIFDFHMSSPQESKECLFFIPPMCYWTSWPWSWWVCAWVVAKINAKVQLGHVIIVDKQ